MTSKLFLIAVFGLLFLSLKPASNTHTLVVKEKITHTKIGGDGKIEVTITGGQAPYRCTWAGGTSKLNIDEPQEKNQNGLKKGEYFLIVYDRDGCNVTKKYRVK